MADPPRHPVSRPHTIPRWVKVMAIIAIVALLLVGILLLTGGHGPRRHLGADGETVEVTTLDTMT
jgi:hypothetical protein